MIESITTTLASLKFEGIFGYVTIFTCIFIGHSVINRIVANKIENEQPVEEEEEEEEEPPRNFTFQQLAYFDGKKDEKTLEQKPVYLSLNGIVFDVSKGRDFYGEGGPYEQFAGHECGVALAKMSFDSEHLDDVAGCESLSYVEKDELEGWIQKFKYYRCYPVKGRLIPDTDLPDPNSTISNEELKKHNGEGEIPDKYATAPIYIGAGGKVYDMSFGGVTFYGKGCAYNVFAGNDASRSLALMSLDSKDAMNPDISDLNEKQIKVMNDWIKTFEERKLYPVVGTLKKD
jgi:membrane-associated progesterone receptor component